MSNLFRNRLPTFCDVLAWHGGFSLFHPFLWALTYVFWETPCLHMNSSDVCMHKNIYAYIHMYMLTCILTQIYPSIHPHTHIHTIYMNEDIHGCCQKWYFLNMEKTYSNSTTCNHLCNIYLLAVFIWIPTCQLPDFRFQGQPGFLVTFFFISNCFCTDISYKHIVSVQTSESLFVQNCSLLGEREIKRGVMLLSFIILLYHCCMLRNLWEPLKLHK